MKSITKVALGIACGAIGIGIILGIIGFSAGGRAAFSNLDHSFSYSDTAENVTSINMDIHYGKVQIVQGNRFNVDVSNTIENGFRSEVVNGVWYLEDVYDKTRTINIFGFSIPFMDNWFGGHHDNDYPVIVVTIPSDFDCDSLEAKLQAGSLNIESIKTRNAAIDVNAGEMVVTQMTVEENASFDVDAGAIKILDLEANKVNFDCGAGSIKATGKILGDVIADCGVGEIKLELEGNEKDYNYFVDCDLGGVSLNGNERGFSGHDTVRNENAIADFKLKCGVGYIKVNFNK